MYFLSGKGWKPVYFSAVSVDNFIHYARKYEHGLSFPAGRANAFQ
jgi:hypothetical protein